MENQNEQTHQGHQQPQFNQTIVLGKQKSAGVAFLLTFLFGPLGLLYASVTGGIIMMLLGGIVGFLTLGLGLIPIWIICIIWAMISVNNSNNIRITNSNTESQGDTNKTKKNYVILIILALAILIGGTICYRLYYKTPPNTADLKANATVSIDKITSDFKSDSAKARKKYNNDVIAMSGTVDKTEKDQAGHIYIDFVANNVKVQCLVEDDAKGDAESIKAGQNVNLKGKFTGYTFDEMIDPQPQLQFRDCIIVK